jgi:hypothetical protein
MRNTGENHGEIYLLPFQQYIQSREQILASFLYVDMSGQYRWRKEYLEGGTATA